MSLPAANDRLRDADKRYANMSTSALIMEWDDRLFESERVLLAEELEARNYRMKSLEPPMDDLPDGDEAEVKRGREELEGQRASEERKADDRNITTSALICYAIATFTLVAHGGGYSGAGLGGLGSWPVAIGTAAVFVSLGRAIHRGSKVAAFTALSLYGLEVFLRIWFAIDSNSVGEGRGNLRMGGSIALFILLFRSAVALSRRSRLEGDTAQTGAGDRT